jgi:hypothetical protein
MYGTVRAILGRRLSMPMVRHWREVGGRVGSVVGWCVWYVPLTRASRWS